MVGRILRHVTQLHFDTLAIATFRPAHDSETYIFMWFFFVGQILKSSCYVDYKKDLNNANFLIYFCLKIYVAVTAQKTYSGAMDKKIKGW